MAIADAIEEDIKHGRLKQGAKMPTHRDLADALGVTVGTVTRGYAEAARRGLLRGETGRGTFVGRTFQQQLICHHENLKRGVVDMKVTLPFEPLSPDLGKTLREIADDPASQRLLEYYPSVGRLVDREAGAEWLRRYNLDILPDNICLTVGGQNSLTVALTAMFRPGDTIAVERLTYPLIKTLAHRFHLKLVTVEQDELGMIPESLEEVCRTQTVRGIYVMPTCQNPTTARMPEYRRHEIADTARRYDLTVLEDDAYGLAAGDFGVPFAALVPERTFFVASLSKSLAGGLRVAFLTSPPRYLSAIKAAISDMVWMTPPLMADIARRWIEDGTADHTLKIKRAEAQRRTELTGQMMADLDITMQKTSYFAWFKLPAPWTAREFARLAKENDLLVSTDDIFAVGRGALPHALRLSISGPETTDDLVRGLTTIRTILELD
ncbi:PLP-dependent aminotransferase family protein [Pseudodesulfovibrio sp. zrk46]|uniref:aminotransferase-like domain-containing protein n=1 Tax=Pseudodesulfovibrio sp. zrk46 TaxID=2725288 RepID=UPI001FFDDBF4|nr:PLP-dependent aminotransferase family protein [Pseudodesulfovibrio sp. zrk46]